jgi:transposase
MIFQAELPEARALPASWISWARRSRIPTFVRLVKTIKHFPDLILNAVEHGLSNARSEAINTHLRLLTRRAYGYHSPDSLIAMADLTRGGLGPPLPGRPRAVTQVHQQLPAVTSVEPVLHHCGTRTALNCAQSCT